MSAPYQIFLVEGDTPVLVVSAESVANVSSANLRLMYPDETLANVAGVVDLDADTVSFQVPALPQGVTQADVTLVNDVGQITFPAEDVLRLIARAAL